MAPLLSSDEIEKTRRRTERRTAVEADRRSGKSPLVVEKIGDLVLFWATTGLITSGSSATLYFSDTGLATGVGVFSRKPMTYVSRDEVPFAGVGMLAATGPISSTESYSVSVNMGLAYSGTVSWDTTHKMWKVLVSNSTGATRDFLVEGFGV